MKMLKVFFSLTTPFLLLFIYFYFIKNILHGIGSMEFTINIIAIVLSVIIGFLFLAFPISIRTLLAAAIYFPAMYFVTFKHNLHFRNLFIIS